MNKLSTKLAAGVTLVLLGGLAGFAVKDNHPTASTAAQKQVPVQVRTEVIRRTVRIHRKPKAPKPPRAAATSAAAPPRQAAAVVPAPPVAAPAKAHAPLRTRTSGAVNGSGERELESENEGHDD